MNDHEGPNTTNVRFDTESLGDRGRALWDAMTAEIEYTTTETEVLVEACRTLDRIDELTAAVSEAGTMIAGSQGQMILHPAIGEVRQQQAAFVRLVAALKLPQDAAADEKFRTARARAGATARWQGNLAVM